MSIDKIFCNVLFI